MKGPLERFSDELHDLLMRWRNKPDDDRLTTCEAVGVLVILAIQVANDGCDMARDTDDDVD